MRTADDACAQIVFFEMNFQFETGSERIAVIESLRRPDICFPDSWEAKRAQQKSSECPSIMRGGENVTIYDKL